MALSDKEMERLSALLGSRKTTDFSTMSQVSNGGLQDRLADVGNNASTKIKSAIQGTGDFAGQSPEARALSATAAGFGVVPQAALAMAPEPVRTVVGAVGDFVGKGFNDFTALIGSNPSLQKWTQENPEATTKIMEALQKTSDLGAIAGTIAGTKAVAGGVNKVTETIGTGTRATAKIVGNASSLVKQKVKSPEKTLPGAVGEIIQGKPDDIARGLEALKAVDTSNVKTYAELGTKIDDGIESLSRVVDDELAKDVSKIKLADLNTNLKTKSGNAVSTNYVKTALEHLKELYTKTGEVDKAGSVDELIENANTNGLSKVEINDIARVYNTEFGSKAFSPATGDPLTSVNAQLYENVRKGVKTKAREGIGGEKARTADQTVSALYNTKKLVQKNTEAVNKLQQKIAERGIFEKAGYYLSKYADIATGGTIRGLVGGILPRGAGYKTMNALDLEERLESNLEIINRASKATTDAEMTKILSELEQ